MGQLRRSPLFRAIVLAGASLTQVAALTQAGCGGVETPDPSAGDGATSTANDSGTTNDAANTPDAAEDAGTCPPGSERPVPPCALIR